MATEKVASNSTKVKTFTILESLFQTLIGKNGVGEVIADYTKAFGDQSSYATTPVGYVLDLENTTDTELVLKSNSLSHPEMKIRLKDLSSDIVYADQGEYREDYPLHDVKTFLLDLVLEKFRNPYITFSQGDTVVSLYLFGRKRNLVAYQKIYLAIDQMLADFDYGKVEYINNNGVRMLNPTALEFGESVINFICQDKHDKQCSAKFHLGGSIRLDIAYDNQETAQLIYPSQDGVSDRLVNRLQLIKHELGVQSVTLRTRGESFTFYSKELNPKLETRKKYN